MPSPNLPYEFAGPPRTERLLVRAMVARDVDDVHAYHSREDVCRYLPYEPRTRDEVAEKVARNAAELTLAAEGDYWQLAVERLDAPGRVIGTCSSRCGAPTAPAARSGGCRTPTTSATAT
jgi:RimJ/RimL family protein N-acetyltransferase